jgi:diguanylate cyclase (GGDEF)-like protein
LRGWQAAAAAGLTAFALHVGFGLGGPGSDHFFDRWLYSALLLLASGAALARAVAVAEERAVWLLLGAGLTSWSIGDIYYTFAYANVGSPPFPSLADVFYLCFYPAAYVALILLVRARVREFPRAVWWDGVLATLAFAALGAAILVETVLRTTEGSVAVVATNLAYPLGDTLLLALTVGVFAVTGWRPGWHWGFIGGGFAALAVADGFFLVKIADGSYVEGSYVDALWPAAMLLLAQAAWQRTNRNGTIRLAGRSTLVTPLLCGLIGIGVLAYGHFQQLNLLALSLAIATLLAVIVRTGMTFNENQEILARIRAQAVTDALTGLGNRRKLFSDLSNTLASADLKPSVLIIYDLDGFKRYNDNFGHPAGDALLARLGAKLACAVDANGEAYRLGGDEFCVLAAVEQRPLADLVEATRAALSEAGDAFQITPSQGSVLLPGEAAEPAVALRLADQRLYDEKRSKRPSRAPEDLLLRATYDRDPTVQERARRISGLSVALARRLGLKESTLGPLRRAAELHDIGTVAIPDEILRKPGPLTPQEWALIERHTELGQRILEAAPALNHEARILRSTHERWDGNGYPDRLAGQAIPLMSRIISACAAYTAMTSTRPHRTRLSDRQALDELRAHAGTQFDPHVIEALCRLLDQSQPNSAAA